MDPGVNSNRRGSGAAGPSGVQGQSPWPSFAAQPTALCIRTPTDPPLPPPDPRLSPLLRLATTLRQSGKLSESLPPLQQAARIAPRNAQIQHDLGLTCLNLNQPETALRHFDRAISLEPQFGHAHFRRGAALESLSRPGAAESYRRAIAATPSLAEAYGRLASMQLEAGRRGDALALYRDAASHAPAGSVAALMFTARAALLMDDLAEAERAVRHVLARDPKAANARGLLAYILNTRGEFAPAEAELLRALEDRPGDIALYFDLVQIRRLTAQDAPLIARMRAAQAHIAPAPARIRLHLALAKALDDIGDEAAAMREIDAAGALREHHAPMNRAALTAHTDHQIKLLGNTHRSHQGSASALPILVLGLPRSGTTLTEQILSSHPAVAGAGEVLFWDAAGPALLQALGAGAQDELAAAATRYLARLASVAPDAGRVVDKNPFNYRWLPLIHQVLPQARIIHCRRHPADNCLSIMMAHLAPQTLFGTARADLLFCYREYQRLMAHVRTALPAGSFHEIQYERLVANPEPQIRALLEFCDLPWNDACLQPERNTRAVRTASVWQVRQPIYASSSGRRHRYAAWLGEFEALADTG
jgi:tetratricopeptide (TPR) repeat protein